MTGKININVDEITDNEILTDFIDKGLNPEIKTRFHNITEVQEVIKRF